MRADGSQSIEPVLRCGTTAGSCVAIPLDLGPATDQLFLALFGTGFRNRAQLSDVSARIGGVLSEVLFAGAQGDLFGLDQLNLRVPRSLAGRGSAPLIYSVAGRSTMPVYVNIR